MNALNAKYAAGRKEAIFGGIGLGAAGQLAGRTMPHRISKVNNFTLFYIGALGNVIVHTISAAAGQEGEERRALADQYDHDMGHCTR